MKADLHPSEETRILVWSVYRVLLIAVAALLNEDKQNRAPTHSQILSQV
jgi:hypothetical protein